MKRLNGSIIALAILSCPLQAQRQPQALPETRPADALWFSASGGRGFARVDCDICRGSRSAAFAGSLRMGARVSRRVLVGAEVSGWLNGEDQLHEHIWVLSGIGQYYLGGWPRAFVKVGVSALNYRIEDTQETLSSSAIGLQAGLGYDLPVARRLYLTPSVTLSHGILGGRLKFNGAELDETAHATLIQLGVGVTRK